MTRKVKIFKRLKELNIITSYLIKNLGEDGDEVLINAMNIISQISRKAIENSLKLFQEVERKTNKRLK